MKLSLVVATLFITFFLNAQESKWDNFYSDITSPAGVSQTISQALTTHQVNSVSIAIVEGDKITEYRQYGYIDKQKSARVDEDTMYQVASMSKFVASIGIVEAERQGVLSLTESASSIAEDYPDSILDKWVKRKFKDDELDYPDSITLKRLLSHSAGLDTHSIGTQMPGFVKTMSGIILGNILDPTNNGVQPIYAPGTKYSYSGGGYTVAEHILELKSEQSFSEYVTSNVLEEVGMDKSTYDKAVSSMENLARGCSRGVCLYDVMQTNVKAAGGLLATADDYAKLLIAFLNDGYVDGRLVINKSVINKVLEASYNVNSSNLTCSTDSNCPQTKKVCFPGICVNVPTNESCYLNKCRDLLNETYVNADGVTVETSTYDGLGVELSGELLTDGYHRYAKHSGAQTGFSTQYYMDRKKKIGIVIFVAGNEKWTSGNLTYGGAALKSAILSAFQRNY